MRTNLFSRWIKKSLGLEKRFGKRQTFRQALKPRLEVLEDRLAPAAYVVTTTADTGSGSLRDAINQVNADPSHALYASLSNPSVDEIDFSITAASDTGAGYNAATGVATILPQSGFASITTAVMIDGWSQPGFASTPLIEISGGGLDVRGGNSTLRGLCINSCVDAVVFGFGNGDVLEGCFIGTDVTGKVSKPNSYDGVAIGSSFNRIGTDGDGVNDAAEGNIISNNGERGIFMENPAISGNVIAGNRIGTDVTGTQAMPNRAGGIRIDFAHDNLIGTSGHDVDNAGERNLISGNGNFGIYIAGGSNNVVAGNYIGTDVSGTQSLPNPDGIDMGGDHTLVGTDANGVALAATRNVISGNGDGIQVGGTHNVVAGNFIGTDPTGLHANLNGGYGIFMGGQYNRIGTNGDGVNDAAEGNVIDSGFTDIYCEGDYGAAFNAIAGNLIGTDVTGTKVLTANSYGIKLAHGAHDNRIGANASDIDPAAERNVISGHNLAVDFDGGHANTIAGNLIGSDITGLLPLGNTNGIGTNDANDQILDNLISAAGSGALGIGGSGNLVAGNLIGTDITGTTSLGGGLYDGVSIGGSNNIIGGTAPGARNVICGYARSGIGIYGAGATGNAVEGNYIGTDVTGTKALGNGPGVLIDGASGNAIGGTAAGAGNTIAYNSSDGVFLNGGSSNSILGNSIHDNGGLGISFHGGANYGQAAPVLLSAVSSSSGTVLSGTLAGSPGGVRIEFFSNQSPDPSGFGEGQTFLGFATTDAQGNFTANLPETLQPGYFLAATATDVAGDTSQFSADVIVKAATTTSLLTSVNPSVYGQSVTFTAAVSNATTGSSLVPTGSAQFFIDGVAYGSAVALDGTGQASITDSQLPVTGSPHSVTVSYSNSDGHFSNSNGGLTGGQTITRATPTLTTAAGPTVVFGSGLPLTESGTLSGPPGMGGTLTFTLYDPSGAVVDTETAPVSGPGTYPTPTGAVPGQAGIYHWLVRYSGDVNDYPVGPLPPLTDAEEVARGTPAITWANPADIMSGTALSATQLDATANVPGGFSYSPGLGTVLGIGPNQTLSATFTPTDATDYNSASASVTINVQETPSLTVTTLADVSDPFDGQTSLREAITYANSLPGASTITFGPGLSGTITLTGGALSLNDTGGTMAIQGPGASLLTIDGNQASGVFAVSAGVSAALDGLTIADGNADSGGGINNAGTLTLSNSALTANSAYTGGGISNTGTLTVSDCTFANNTAGFYGAGIVNVRSAILTITRCTFAGNTAIDGAGINNDGELTVSDSSFTGGSVRDFGGAVSASGTVAFANCTFAENTAGFAGGAINDGDGTFTLSNCTILNNSSGNLAGGIEINNSTATISQCSLSGNTAANFGGAISNGDFGSSGPLTIDHTALSGNGAGLEGGSIYNASGTLTVSNSTLADNLPGNDGGSIANYDSLTLSNSILSSSLGGIVSVYGTTGSDVIAASASGGNLVVNQNGTQYSFPLTSVGEINIYGQGGGDIFTIDFGNLPASINLADSSSGNSLTVFGVPDAALNRITKTPGTITWTDGIATETVSYSGIDSLIVNANGNYANEVIDPGSNTIINGGRGSNTITITATTGSGVVINGGAGANTYIVDLGSLAGPVTVQNNNSTATNSLIVNGAPGNNTIAAAGNQITSGTESITDTAALANLTVTGGSGNNLLTVSSLTVPVQSVTLAGGGGTNTYNVSAATVNVVAGSGVNVLNVTGGTVASITAPAGDTRPLVFAHSYSVLDNGTLSVLASGVLANDISANGQALTAVLASGPAHGTLTLKADGSFTYKPTANFVGTDSFTYQVRGSDGTLSAAAPVTIQVGYHFSGFLAPLNANIALGLNRTVPLKFQLTDASGNAVTSLGAVVSLKVLDAQGTDVLAGAGKTGLGVSGPQFTYNWQTKGLAAGKYTITLVLADGTLDTLAVQVSANGSSAGLMVDGAGSGALVAGALLGGNIEIYVDNSNGELTTDELARVQDAVIAVDAVTEPYGVTMEEVSDPSSTV
jgi:titin